MCEYCEDEKNMMQIEYVNLAMIQWCGETKAKDLHILEDTAGVFIDNRGYLRLVNLNDCSCIEHGEHIKITYCPMCGKKLN